LCRRVRDGRLENFLEVDKDMLKIELTVEVLIGVLCNNSRQVGPSQLLTLHNVDEFGVGIQLLIPCKLTARNAQ
jgi:hypothetical protein